MKTIIYNSVVLKTVIFFTILISGKSSFSQDEGAQNVAKALSNPVANMYSVPFQNNFQFGIGEQKGYKYLLNFQPVIPVSLGKNINLINRAIFPIIFQNKVIGSDRQNGMGDILYTAFFSPAKSKIIWGIGPAASLPTATDSLLGTKKLLLGPSVVVLGQPGSWTLGFLANNLWSVAGSESRSEITSLFVQPFFTYNTAGGMGLGLSSENSYDWRGKRLTSGLIALNLTQVFKFDAKQIASLQLSPLLFYSNEKINKPEWGARIGITLVYPKK
ncbi:MAG: hypothetical protein IPM96_09710 [Ignavibacteria bacterium]|nr:hypothetical protein [Ignavibacteria bacterium]